jgi:hypothetical protein
MFSQVGFDISKRIKEIYRCPFQHSNSAELDEQKTLVMEV